MFEGPHSTGLKPLGDHPLRARLHSLNQPCLVHSWQWLPVERSNGSLPHQHCSSQRRLHHSNVLALAEMAIATEPVVRLDGSTIVEQQRPDVVAGAVTVVAEAARGVVQDGSL